MNLTTHPPRTLLCILAIAVSALVTVPASAAEELNPDATFAKKTKVVSFEGGLGHFGDRLPGSVQEWNVAARFSLLPFNVVHLNGPWRFFDGAFEVGLEPFFERFNTERQNAAGMSLAVRYYLTGLRFWRIVPWVAGSIGPGGSDLNIGNIHKETRLRGPFLARITGEGGFAYFLDESTAVYLGLQAIHISNAALNGGTNYNYGLNTPWAGVLGVSWYFH